MSIEQEIRNEINNIKQLKIDVDNISNHLSALQELCKKSDKWCEGCRHEGFYDETCKNCKNYYLSQYDPMPKKDNSVKVGDEVIWNGDSTIIVTMMYVEGWHEWCDGINQNGKACHVLLENVRKTGRHFNIVSILEAMRT